MTAFVREVCLAAMRYFDGDARRIQRRGAHCSASFTVYNFSVSFLCRTLAFFIKACYTVIDTCGVRSVN